MTAETPRRLFCTRIAAALLNLNRPYQIYHPEKLLLGKQSWKIFGISYGLNNILLILPSPTTFMHVPTEDGAIAKLFMHVLWSRAEPNIQH